MKRAFITGITGQDGSYLARLLLDKGYEVHGGIRRNASGSKWRLDYHGITDQITYHSFELTDKENVHRILDKIKPDEVYNLAAQSFVGSSFDCPEYTMQVNAMGVLYILEWIRKNKETKMYQASTSEMFGKSINDNGMQDENTPLYSQSPYATSKIAAHNMVRDYRESYGLKVCSGILFNHESPLRGEEFVTKKIVKHLVRMRSGDISEPLQLGNVSTNRDWGFAGDYVRAMYMMLQDDRFNDYVVSTGEFISVAEFLEDALIRAGHQYKWRISGSSYTIEDRKGRTLVQSNPDFYRPNDVGHLQGDNSLIKKNLGWEPKLKVSQLIELMINYEVDCVYNINKV